MISALVGTLLVFLGNDIDHQNGCLTTLMSVNEMNICPEYYSRAVVRSILKFMTNQSRKPK